MISACSLFDSAKSERIEPKLLKQAPLPPIPVSMQQNDFEFYCELIISKEGTVERARLIRSTVDTEWDSLCKESLLKWKFSPAIINGNPTRTVIRRKINVIFSDPETMILAEIVCNTSATADSAYEALLNNSDFGATARMFSMSDTKTNNGIIGKINIQHYAENIRRILSRLKENEFTKPLPYGKFYIIFKRIEE
jgi:parvulin-like peptidyl-prolyl isomerase